MTQHERVFMKVGRYKLYASGAVYRGDVYAFTVSDDREFSYLWERGWKSDRKNAEELLDGYHDGSMDFLKREPLGVGFAAEPLGLVS